jgi:small subunit ribosomal protein S16
MLAIRMQRTGRSGNAQFRLVVQESRRTPTSGNVVALLGSYDPHTKTQSLDKDKAAFYLEHGAQPSSHAVRLLQAEGVKLPKWVATQANKQSKLRNPAKLRRNQPKEAAAPAAPDASADAQPDAETTEQA